LDSTGSGHIPVAMFCRRGNEISGSITKNFSNVNQLLKFTPFHGVRKYKSVPVLN
jgi:hypothetical protein